MIRTIATLLTFAGLLYASEAQAQLFFRKATPPMATTYPSVPPAVAVGVSTPPVVYSYSYYTRSNLPVRTYVGYGTNDFPFYGAPYGHPYDPYTWAAMSNSYRAEMARYYYPPLK